MAYDKTLALRIAEVFANRADVVEKKMFGGLVYLLQGNICVGIWKAALIVRLGIDAAEEVLLEPHVRPFDVTGKPMRGWVLVDAPGIVTDEQLIPWIERALAFVGTLPAK